MSAPLIEIEGLSLTFGGQRRFLARRTPEVRAVDAIDLTVRDGESLGIVGESGCGKSTLAKTVFGLLRETAGMIRLDGEIVSGLPPQEARKARRMIQYVHQDPGAALDPWWRVGDTLHETLLIHGLKDRAERQKRIDTLLEAVGLESDAARRYPHELSGGQQRRVGLARILSLRPRVVILDEPTSGLDLSVQASVLSLLNDLRERFSLTYIFISHDLSVVRRICDRVAVIYLGRIAELAEVDALFANPRHPYSRGLFASAPSLEPNLDASVPLDGDPPSPVDVPSGCAFRTRCSYAHGECAARIPPLVPVVHGGFAACPVINPAPEVRHE